MATPLATNIKDRAEACENLIKKVSLYYGEKKPVEAWEDYFEVFIEFCGGLSASEAELNLRIEKAEKDGTLKLHQAAAAKEKAFTESAKQGGKDESSKDAMKSMDKTPKVEETPIDSLKEAIKSRAQSSTTEKEDITVPVPKTQSVPDIPKAPKMEASPVRVSAPPKKPQAPIDSSPPVVPTEAPKIIPPMEAPKPIQELPKKDPVPEAVLDEALPVPSPVDADVEEIQPELKIPAAPLTKSDAPADLAKDSNEVMAPPPPADSDVPAAQVKVSNAGMASPPLPGSDAPASPVEESGSLMAPPPPEIDTPGPPPTP